MAEKIPMEPIESSNLTAIGYDPVTQRLAGQFKTGAIFHYANVSLETVTELYAAPSRGSFFSTLIRGKFPGAKMTGACPKCGEKPGWIGDACETCGGAVYAEERKERTG